MTTTAGPAISPTATLVSLQIIPANLTIVNSGLGATQQYLAVGTYSDGSTQFLTASVTWSSSAAAVATISNSARSSGLEVTYCLYLAPE